MGVYSYLTEGYLIGGVNPTSYSDGFKCINRALRDPHSVQLFESNNKYFVAVESVENYMSSTAITEIDEAIKNIARANDIDFNNINVVGSFDEQFLSENLSESVILEKAAEDNAMTLKQAEKYMNTVIKNCKSKAETKQQVDDCIKILKQCVKDMEHAKSKAESDLLDGGRMRYALRSFIPFNGIYRLFKKNDWEAGISDLTKLGAYGGLYIWAYNVGKDVAKTFATDGACAAAAKYADSASKVAKVSGVVSGVTNLAYLGVRMATYTKMLDRMIKNTNEAIDYLEKKKKEL